jgi:hypothetical protein
VNLIKQLKCECSNWKFWYFGSYVTCPECLNKYKTTTYKDIDTGDLIIEYWVCRYDTERKKYNDTWEKLTNE